MGPLSSLMMQIPLMVEVFARAGGGGSGSDGSAEGMGIGAAIGYFPAHFIANHVRRAFKDSDAWFAAQTVCWVGGAVAALAILVTGMSLGSIMMDIYFVWPAAGGVVTGIGSGLYGWWGKLRQSRAVKDALEAAAENDSTWDEDVIEEKASQIFMRYQQDWSRGDMSAIATYATPYYAAHAGLMIRAMAELKRRNDVQNPMISEAQIIDMVDADDDTKDTVTIGFTAHANDLLIDARSDTTLYIDKNEFTEYWTLRRDGNDWRIAGIAQATENPLAKSGEIESFGRANSMYYSPDWGCLLLPTDGELFRKGAFGKSDINNHLIGTLNDTVVQLYTYNPNLTDTSVDPYIVAQISVPRTYGRIVVRRRGMINTGIRGLQKIQMEWQQFNRTYDVFASNGEGATSFELLNPTFMEYLESLPMKLSIEVVDNTVYIYAKNKKISLDSYTIMLEVLRRAHKEMRM